MLEQGVAPESVSCSTCDRRYSLESLADLGADGKARYERALGWLAEGAERGGRSLADVAVCHFTTCYLGDDRAACLHEAKRMLARYATLPFYGNMLADCGFADDVAAIREAMKTRDVEKPSTSSPMPWPTR